MARIRTVKPETWTSESLAEVTLTAERTFLGLLSHSDDHGRTRDNAAIIAGLLWPLRAEHTAVHVEDDLHQLATAGLICRYSGCDGRRYLHIVTWFQHQKIDKPSQTRLPACPEHHAAQRCGACKGTCVVSSEASENPQGGIAEDPPRAPASPLPLAKPEEGGNLSSHRRAQGKSAPGGRPKRVDADQPRESAGQAPVGEDSPNTPRGLGEASTPGSRILDPGSSTPTGRTAPAQTGPSAKELVGEYVAGCAERPPSDVIGHLGRVVKGLLAEGIAVHHIRAGLERFRSKPMHPSVLPSLVNEAMNTPTENASPSRFARPESRSTVPAHRAWSNPADPAAAYAEEL